MFPSNINISYSTIYSPYSTTNLNNMNHSTNYRLGNTLDHCYRVPALCANRTWIIKFSVHSSFVVCNKADIPNLQLIKSQILVSASVPAYRHLISWHNRIHNLTEHPLSTNCDPRSSWWWKPRNHATTMKSLNSVNVSTRLIIFYNSHITETLNTSVVHRRIQNNRHKWRHNFYRIYNHRIWKAAFVYVPKRESVRRLEINGNSRSR